MQFKSSIYDKNGNEILGGTGSAINMITSQVDFGSSGNETFVSSVITGLSYITSSSKITLSLLGEDSGDRSAEDGIIEGIVLGVSNIVAGIGFTINAYAPDGANGIYKLTCFIGG